MPRTFHLMTCAAVLTLGALGGLVASRSAAQPPARPRLIVLLVADQLRADYLDMYRHRWRRGFRTLLDQGAWFTRAEYPYLNTATCAGHVTIGTGALPRTHGIVLNRWWDRDEQRAITCTDDPASPDVSYGDVRTPVEPPARGNGAHRILVPTLADELRAQRPGARVVALSLKARGAIPLAGRGGVVTWFDEVSGAFVTSRAFADEPVPALAAFIARDAPDGDLGQVWHLQEPAETYRSPDLAAGEQPKAGWASIFPHRLEGADGADAQFVDRWQKSPFSDAYLGRMATALADDLELGRRDTTDLLAVSFSALDLLGHDFGPESREVEDLLIRLDTTVGALLDHLDARVGRDNYTVALTADHGAAPTPEQSGGGRIASEDIQHLTEQTLVALWGSREAPYVAWVGSGAIYFADGIFQRLRQDDRALETVTRALLRMPGMMRVLHGDASSADSRDAFVRAAAAGYVRGRTADLLLVPRRNWVIELRAEYEATTHGTFHEYDRQVPILLRGHGIRPGRYRARVSPADIAPTLAFLAGVSLPEADGRLLREAMR